jgi:hypothetical protein
MIAQIFSLDPILLARIMMMALALVIGVAVFIIVKVMDRPKPGAFGGRGQ